jgi:ATP-dependent RNA helicase RhlE
MQHCSELNLCSALRNSLAKNEFVTPTPVQAQSIPPIMEGHDVVVTAQTGTGKPLAFSIPVIEALAAVPRTKTIKVLILSPRANWPFRSMQHSGNSPTACASALPWLWAA